MIRNSLHFLSFLLLLSACREDRRDIGNGEPAVQSFRWMVGTWYIPGEEYFEEWAVSSDTSFSGRAYRVDGKDTIPLEEIALFIREGKLVYAPTFQREGIKVTVEFPQKNTGMDTLIFENLENPFPKMIYYEKVGSDSLFVYIQGTDGEGSTARRYFSMKRTDHGGSETD